MKRRGLQGEKMCNKSAQYIRNETLKSTIVSHHSVLLLLK